MAEKVQILIGRIAHGWECEAFEYENCFSIRIENNVANEPEIITRKDMRVVGQDDKHYIESCLNAGREFRDKLRDRGITDYEIINGVRTKSSDVSRVIDCEYMPHQGVRQFVLSLEGKDYVPSLRLVRNAVGQ